MPIEKVFGKNESRVQKIPKDQIPVTRPNLGFWTLVAPKGEELHFIEDSRAKRRIDVNPKVMISSLASRFLKPFAAHPRLSYILHLLPK